MENQEKRIIEINGIKMEVDLRTAKRIDEFKLGDSVKVLKKNGSDYTVTPGVIIDFVNFKELPTIQIVIFKMDYWGNHVDFINFNESTKDIEISKVSDHELRLEKSRIIDKFNIEIEKKQGEADELKAKRQYILDNFGKYFENKTAE
jgi:hypothetical protein